MSIPVCEYGCPVMGEHEEGCAVSREITSLRAQVDEWVDKVPALRAEVERLDGTVAHWVGEVRNLDLALVSMTKAHDVVAAERDRLQAEVRALRDCLLKLLRCDPCDVMEAKCVMQDHDLVDDYGKPMGALLTGEPGPGGEK